MWLQREGFGAFVILFQRQILINYVVAMGIRFVLKQFFCGVPQGGIWSPKLWIFYIQDLALCFVRSELFKYADDLTSLNTFMERDRQEAIAHINQDLKRVLRWGKK